MYYYAVPDVPMVMITPIYSNDDQELIKISSIIEQEVCHYSAWK